MPEAYGNPSSSELKIGTLKDTTSLEVIKNAFPDAVIDDSVKNRAQAVIRLQGDASKTIDAYAGDEILLAQILRDEKGMPSQFSIIPRFQGYSREDYGVVVY
ncbi:MAG: hypothetical protein ACK559_06490, partial [bacterium]